MNTLSRYLVLTFLLLHAGCASLMRPKTLRSDDLLVDSSCTLLPQDDLSREEIEQDISVLLFALENAYGARNHISQEGFIRAVAALRELGTAEPRFARSSIGLCDRIGQALALIPDQHLVARIKGHECTPAGRFRTGSVGRNVSRSKEKPWDINYRVVKGKQIPIVSITSMPKPQDPVWDGFLDQVSALKRTAPAIILDLRGNGGGNDRIGYQLAAVLYGQAHPSVLDSIIRRKTPAAVALKVNQSRLSVARLKQAGKPVPAFVEERLARDEQEYKDALSGKLPAEVIVHDEEGFPFEPAKAFNRPLYILVDAKCASSCEEILTFFEGHPKAVTVGENSAGFVHFGNVGQLVLPHSQIQIWMGSDFWKYKDGRFVERIGYAPKLKVPAGGDALDAALRALRKQIK